MLNTLSRLDYFSLIVFIELIEQQNVTLVALKLNVTQPKVSRTLNILRKSFGDELLTREQYSMKPTKLAESLYYPAKQLLEHFQLLADVVDYHSHQKKEINVATQNHMSTMMLECLQLTAAELSLNYTFNMHPWSDQVQRLHGLTQLDYSLAVNPPDSEKINKYWLAHINKFFLVAHREHPIFSEPIGINNALSYSLALLNYCITEQKQHRIEILAEKFRLPINIILKTMDLDLLLHHLEHSNSISYIASLLIKLPIANRKTLKAVDVTQVFSKKGNDIQREGGKRPEFSLYLQASETSPILFTRNLTKHLKRHIANLNY
ncbi:LysR family transcriptional regulator [Shewanella putrefaciens]|uniref:Transcriptional regulator, LysR family n=1 Tax=Shewanella putrefaciens (strain 200) TaxID=399804 RepID=E6XHA2_SHEP2